MIRSLFTGVSGLKQHQTKMDVLSNNIANVDTTAFKRSRTMFQDMFSETLRHGQQAFGDYGGLNPMQVGLGVKNASIDTLMDQGAIESTGKQTDVAIEGDGFFTVQGYDGNTYYTRDGNLNVSSTYDLVMTNTGFKMQGWLATQNKKTGNLEMKETGVVPYDININRYLKKHAHQTNEVKYSCNLDSGSSERDVEMGLDTLTFKDSSGSFQNLQFKFKKLDANNWIWSANDDSEGNVATGTLKTDDDGKVIESTVEPAGPTSSVANPYFTYDPDGDPQPGSATMPTNAVTNTGDGISSGVTVSGTEVKDETVQVIFDGGDPTRATSFRVVGSERGFIGAGTLGGEQARIEGTPVAFGTHWTPANDTVFELADNQFTPPRVATISFTGGNTYSASDVANQITTGMKAAGVRATAYYDAVTQKFQIVSNEGGSNRELQMQNSYGDLADLGFADTTARGTGGARPEVFSVTDEAVNNSTAWDPEHDIWDPASDVSLTITDRNGRSALISFSDIVAGNNQIYTRGAILAEINSRLAQENVDATAAFVDTDNDNSPDQLVITGNKSGSGERVIISGDGSSNQLGIALGETRGTAAISDFNYGGLSFTLTEGANPWLPNETMSMITTAEKGASNSVNIAVPQPSSDMLTFSTTVNGETFKIDGAVSKGATHSTNIIIYDSLGSAHGMVTQWEHTNAETMEWTYKIKYSDDDPEIVAWLKDPANNIVDAEDPTPEDLERANDALIKNREGKMYFFNNGKIDAGKTFTPDVELQPEGSNPLSINLTTELITQFKSDFSTKAEYQDGYEMGLLEQIYFEDDGIIRGIYSNGQKQPIGQVALTTFNNPAGLEKNGKNLYTFSPSSGQPIVNKPGSAYAGTLVPASLEMSNVDISEEFTNMIITQRAFQANSRVITTSDELLQEVVNLKR
ncbi:MAG TPA: flagellar hook-basal body complex protein [Candidatus Rifleibacterium sp.]|nr:flagellar hook-basal body complex protein [Candidatus Rifleibacterium sp.]HPT47504.1 flagellar hook-basal body complex protein [Candidatus Rifleibacterium sp.]